MVVIWNEEKVKGFTATEDIGEGGSTGEDSTFFLKYSSLLLEFRLNKVRVSFFLALGVAVVSFILVSMEKVEIEPRLSEKVKA